MPLMSIHFVCVLPLMSIHFVCVLPLMSIHFVLCVAIALCVASYVYSLYLCVGFILVLALFVYWLYLCIDFICVLALFMYWLHVCIGFISRTNQRSVLQYEWQFVFSFWFFDINLTCSSQYLETNTTQHKKPFFQSYCSSECKSSISRQNFPMREPMISHCVLSQKRWTHSD